jgi:TPR repeat protein
MVNACDLEAADPDDPARLAPGVHWDLVNVRNAIRACAAAVVASPHEPRLVFQLARVLDISGRVEWAIPFYERAGEANYSAALTNLAYIYRTGRLVPKDYGRALRLARRAALLGNDRARLAVALIYRQGLGVEVSTEEALLWNRLSAADGWPNAVDSLASFYRNGEGVDKDPAVAFKLQLAAAMNGQLNAMAGVGTSYLKGDGTTRDVAEGVRWLETATESGHTYAPLNLALYLQKQDPGRAEQLMLLSADRGHAAARFELARFYLARKRVEDAYFQARIAEEAGERRSPELRAQIAGELTAAEREAVESRVQTWLLSNGR